MTLADQRTAGPGAPPAQPRSRARISDEAAPGGAPDVSVVIPAYEAEATLGQALQSVAAQRGVAWEAIVVDDGSTDGTGAVADRWRAKDGRFRLVRQANRGVAAARNLGLSLARGEWICFLDADDWLAPAALSRLLERAEAGADVVVGRARRVGERGRTWAHPVQDLSDPFAVLSSHCAILVHSALVRRSAALAVGGFDETLRSSEDWDFWQRLARAGRRFVQTNACVALYRTRAGSLSRTPAAAAEHLRVLRRGHGPDPRVPDAAARWALGAPADALGSHELYFVLWAGGREIAAGGDGLGPAGLLSDLDVDFEPEAIGELVASGMADMLGRPASSLGQLWPEFEPRLARLLEAVCPGEARHRLRALALAAVKARLGAVRTGDPDLLDLDAPSAPPAVATGADFVALQLARGGAAIAAAPLPRLADLGPEDLADGVASQLGRAPLTPALRALRPWGSAAFWAAVLKALSNLRGSALRKCWRDRRWLRTFARQRLRYALLLGMQAAARRRLARAAPQSGPSPHALAVEKLRAEAAGSRPPAVLRQAREPAAPSGGLRPAEPERAKAWDAFFSADDPWNYGGSAYEQLKYQDTLELLPAHAGCALELACAEGHFTARLAERVGALTATDISATALERAAGRCRGRDNVGFRRLDFMRRPIPGRYDLIVCSEVLYYAGARLPAVARKLAGALAPGGVLVMAHANLISDEPEADGFDWGHAYGAKTIGEAVAAVPGLRLTREIHRPLYRVQAFRKDEAGEAHEPVRERRPLQVALEPAVARAVVWGGGESRIAAFRREAALTLPILMYHRVSPTPGPPALERFRVHPDRFAEQMSFLRRCGYWGVTPEDLDEALRRNRPLPGRPVMITFDDGYLDLAEHAWPELRRQDLAAVLFAPAGRVGGAADWDVAHGPPAPLLSWEEIADLAREGLAVESHGQSHRPLTRLPVREVYRELLVSAELIGKAIGRAPIALCYPYGASDPVVERIAEECGYRLGFSAWGGQAGLSSPRMRLPRVEIAGADDLDSFARKLGRSVPSAHASPDTLSAR